MAKKKQVQINPKQVLHLVLVLVLLAGSLFAWYQTSKEVGCGATACALPANTFLGVPVCMLGATFFTVALILAAALWFVKE